MKPGPYMGLPCDTCAECGRSAKSWWVGDFTWADTGSSFKMVLGDCGSCTKEILEGEFFGDSPSPPRSVSLQEITVMRVMCS